MGTQDDAGRAAADDDASVEAAAPQGVIRRCLEIICVRAVFEGLGGVWSLKICHAPHARHRISSYLVAQCPKISGNSSSKDKVRTDASHRPGFTPLFPRRMESGGPTAPGDQCALGRPTPEPATATGYLFVHVSRLGSLLLMLLQRRHLNPNPICPQPSLCRNSQTQDLPAFVRVLGDICPGAQTTKDRRSS